MAVSEEIRRVLERELVHSVSDLVTAEILFDYLPDALTRHGWNPRLLRPRRTGGRRVLNPNRRSRSRIVYRFIHA